MRKYTATIRCESCDYCLLCTNGHVCCYHGLDYLAKILTRMEARRGCKNRIRRGGEEDET